MVGDLSTHTKQMQYMNFIPCNFKIWFFYKEVSTHGIYFQHRNNPK